MTLMYGVTKSGMLDQINYEADELGLVLPAGTAKHLRDHVWGAIEGTLPAAIETREFIQGIAESLLEPGREECGSYKRKDKFGNEKIIAKYRFITPAATFMDWISPTGFPVANRYRKSKTRPRVVLPFLGQKVIIADGYIEEVRRKKVINSAVANFTHSLDAAHAMRSVNAAVNNGIKNVLTIHDCYATLAPDTRKFARIRREQLAYMYQEENPLIRLWERNVRPGTPLAPPSMGDLDPFTVIFSDYFDR
jgi:DNA-directed RNA polymerase